MITLQNYTESTKTINWKELPKEYQEGNTFVSEVLAEPFLLEDPEIRDVSEQFVRKLNDYLPFDDVKPTPIKIAETKAAIKLAELAKLSKEATKKGKAAPNYNLCDISVPGTNIFCQGNKGIKRANMPQLKGTPVPGTNAAKDAKGRSEVDGENEFKKYLKANGRKLSTDTVQAQDLKSTQSELVGAKVAGMTEALKKDPLNPGITAPIFISKDNYVLDGHHRWAAHVGLDLGNDKDVVMKVIRVDLPIKDLVQKANDFTKVYGIAQKAAKTSKPAQKTAKDRKIESENYSKKRFAKYSDQKLIDLTNKLNSTGANDDDQVYELVRRAKEGKFKLIPEYDTYRIEPISKPAQKTASKPKAIKDLFEFYNEQPKALQKITSEMEEISLDGFSYNQLKEFELRVEAIGFTFDYGLDAEPFNLRKIAPGKSKPAQKTANPGRVKAAIKTNLERMVKKAKAGDYRNFDQIEILKVAQKFQNTRSKASQTRDEGSSSKKRLTPNSENLVRWMNNPGGFDLIGIDTKDLTDPTANLKIKTAIFWSRLGL